MLSLMAPQRDLCDPVLRTRVQVTQTKPFIKLLTGWLFRTESHPKQISNSLVARHSTLFTNNSNQQKPQIFRLKLFSVYIFPGIKQQLNENSLLETN